MYKEITRQRIRFSTNKGLLSLEQLWDLSINDLDALAVSLQEAYDSSKGKSFLAKRTSKDKGLKLQLDVVLDILNTKVEEAELIKEAAETKLHNQKILGLIAEKQEGQLKGKSIRELEAMLR